MRVRLELLWPLNIKDTGIRDNKKSGISAHHVPNTVKLGVDKQIFVPVLRKSSSKTSSVPRLSPPVDFLLGLHLCLSSSELQSFIGPEAGSKPIA